VASASLFGAAAPQGPRAVTKGRLKQSVSRWCYEKIPAREFYRAVAGMGLTAVDLLEEPEWSVVREFGLICSMGYGGGGTIENGLNDRANHDAIVKGLTASIPRAAKLGVPVEKLGKLLRIEDAVAACWRSLDKDVRKDD